MTRVWFHPVFQLFGSVENLILWGSHYFLFLNKRKFIASCLDLSPNRPDQELLLTKFHFYLISGHTEQSVQFFSEWDSSSKDFFRMGTASILVSKTQEVWPSKCKELCRSKIDCTAINHQPPSIGSANRKAFFFSLPSIEFVLKRSNLPDTPPTADNIHDIYGSWVVKSS